MSVDLVVEGDKVALAARSWDGGGRPVVLLHSAGATLEEWAVVAATLAARSLRVFAYDARGHGRSGDADDLSIEAQSRDLDAVIGALALHDAVVVGASMGGYVALQHAVSSDRAAAAVAVDGPVADLAERIQAGQDPPDDAAIPVAATRAHLDATIEEFEAALPALIDPSVGATEAYRRRQHAVRDGRVVRRPEPHQLALISRHIHQQRSTALLRAVRRPVLLVLAGRPQPDNPAGRRRLRARQAVAARITNPAVRVRWIDTGHHISSEAPEAIVRSIIELTDTLPNAKNDRAST